MVRFSHGGHRFAVACGKTFHIYDTYNGNLVGTYQGHSLRIQQLSWTTDDLRIFSCGSDGNIYEWTVDLENGGLLSRKRDHHSQGFQYDTVSASFATLEGRHHLEAEGISVITAARCSNSFAHRTGAMKRQRSRLPGPGGGGGALIRRTTTAKMHDKRVMDMLEEEVHAHEAGILEVWNNHINDHPREIPIIGRIVNLVVHKSTFFAGVRFVSSFVFFVSPLFATRDQATD